MLPEQSLPSPGFAAPPDTLVAVQLLEFFRNSDQDIAGAVDFIRQHPALVAETLKRCNSLRYRRAEPITDIFEAVSRVGFHELSSIVSDSLAAQSLQTSAAAPVPTWDERALLDSPPA